MPVNSSLLHALLLLAVIIVLDECWGFLFFNQKSFSTILFISSRRSHASDISKCNNVVGSQSPHLARITVYSDHSGCLDGVVKYSRPLFILLLIFDSLAKAFA